MPARHSARPGTCTVPAPSGRIGGARTGAITATGSPFTRVTLAAPDADALRRPGGSIGVTSLWPVDPTRAAAPLSAWTARRARQAGALAASGLVLAPTLAAPASVFADGSTVAGSATVPPATTATSRAAPDLAAAPSSTSSASTATPTASTASLPAGSTTTPTTTSTSTASSATTTGAPATTVSPAPQVIAQSSQPTTGVRVTVPTHAPRPATAHRPAKHAAPRHPVAPVSAPAPVVRVPATGANPAAGLPPTPASVVTLGAPGGLSSAVTKTAFAALRLPLTLLPIYQAAGDEYGIPWQVLAAINEVETNYGFDDRTSSAGALGWMQFEPASWQQYGIDAAGQKSANPYNPADAIYAAAAYLRAAGGQTDVRGAVFAYNHSADYVQSVMLRAQLIQSFPQAMIDALTSLSVGRAPVPMSSTEQSRLATTTVAPLPAAPAGARRAHRHGPHAPAAAPAVSRTLRTRAHSPVVSVRDGRVVAVGHSTRDGNYVTVADAEGNQFTYSQLQRVGTPPVAASRSRGGSPPARATHPATSAGSSRRSPASSTAAPLLASELRLLGFAVPKLRAAAPRAVQASIPPAPGQWAPLSRGELLSAGSVLGQVGDDHGTGVLDFALRPAGSSQTVDPGPYLTAWNLREKVLAPDQAAADARLVHDPSVSPPAAPVASSAAVGIGHQLPGGQPPLTGVTAVAPAPTAATTALGTGSAAAATATPTNYSLRQVKPRAGASDVTTWGDESTFFKSKATLSSAVLKDHRISIDSCGRQDIAAHRADRRVLAMLEYLANSGLHPTLSALKCGQTVSAVDIARVNGMDVKGHQGSGTITDIAIQRLLALPSGLAPDQIVSLMTYTQATNTMSSPSHSASIHVAFRAPVTAPPATSKSPATPKSPAAVIAQVASSRSALSTTLSSSQWQQLTAHLESLGDPPLLLPGASAAPQVNPANG